MLMCGSYTDEYNTVIPDVVGTEKKSFTYQISCFCTVKINVCNRGVLRDMESVGG